jgi:hypothetical protein
MGAGASFPNEIDHDTFNSLTDNLFPPHLWESLCPVENKISKETFFGFANELYDVFLTHDWNTDELGRDNHVRVNRINEEMKKMGFRTWFDEERMNGQITQKMIDGIDRSICVIVFITKNYIQKASGTGLKKDQDNCYIEFEWAQRNKGRYKMIPIVMEPRCQDTTKWFGLVGSTLGGTLYVNHSSDEKLENTVNDLTEKIMTIVQTPLNKRFSNMSNSSVGAVVTSYDQSYDSSAIATLQQWFMKLDVSRQNALKYAEKMIEKGVPTIEKLRKIIKKKDNDSLASVFGIDEFDIDDVYDALMVNTQPQQIVEVPKTNVQSQQKKSQVIQSKSWTDAKNFQTLKGHTNYVTSVCNYATSVCFSPDGLVLASASWDFTVRLWNAHTYAQMHVLEGHTGYE